MEYIMNKTKIIFETIEDIQEFSKIVKNYPFDMDMSKGSIVIDAKSLLGLMSLGTNNELILTIQGDFSSELLDKIKPFIIT